MPPLLAAIPVALATAATAAGTAAATGVGVAGAATLASSLGISLTAASAIIAGGEALAIGTAEALLAPSQPKATAQPIQLNFAQDPLEQRKWAYGTAADPGTLKYWETVGPNNGQIWYVSAVHDTPCNAFTAFYIDHGLVTFDGGGNVTTAKYMYSGVPKMFRYDKLGSLGQLAEPNMVAASALASGQWTDNHRLLGIAYFVWMLQYESHTYTQGVPTPLLVLQGRKLWDPRDAGLTISSVTTGGTFHTSTAHGLVSGDMVFITGNDSTFINQRGAAQIIEHEWKVHSIPTSTSFTVLGPDDTQLTFGTAFAGGTATKMNWANNGALALLDYIIGPHIMGQRIGGCGVPLTGINLPTFSDGANVCDDAIAVKGGGTVPRYTVDGFVGSQEDKLQVIASMLLSMGCGGGAGGLSVEQGQICLHVGAPEVATITLTDDDLADAITINPSKSIQDKHNTYDSVYYDYLANNAQSPVPERTSDTYRAEDGGLTLVTNPIYRFTNNLHTAERLDKIGLETEREQLQTDAIWKPSAKRIPLMGTYYWTSDAAGYAAKKMRVVERHHLSEGRMRLISREENDAKWTWDADTEEMDPPASSDNTSSGGGTQQPSGESVTIVSSQAQVSCTDPGDSDLWLHVEYLKHTTSTWFSIPIATNTYDGLSATLSSGTYDFRFFFVSQATGSASEYVFFNSVVV